LAKKKLKFPQEGSN